MPPPHLQLRHVNEPPGGGNWNIQCLGIPGYPETNSKLAPENRPKPNRKGSYSNHPFSGAMLVSGRVVFEKKKLMWT